MLSGKVALITGSGGGLGKAIGLSLLEAGASVVLTDLLLQEEDASKDKVPRNRHPLVFKMDVTRPEQISKVVDAVTERLGVVDILVNNAGVMGDFALLEDQTKSNWQQNIDVNLTGSFHCSKKVWAGMKAKKWGRIINISSFVGEMGSFGQPGYGASKAGLIGLTRSLALEGAQHNITVNAVMPGFIETEIVKSHRPEILERVKNVTAMKRLGRPEEVAALVVFLASEFSSYMTGTAIPVTGGADLFVF
ncbi:MAG: SDR family oxidoreductase [Deltaproteobacteria bacterium]|nr:SDR family oxidoreductase [Deltaproteobacteria bacterium]